MGEPLGVQRHAITGPQDVRLLLDDVEQAFPGEISCDAFGFVEDDPQFVQRVDDVDAVTFSGPMLGERLPTIGAWRAIRRS